MLGVEHVDLRLFVLKFPPLVLSLLLVLNSPLLCFFSNRPVPVFLLDVVLLELGVPGGYLAVVFTNPSLLHPPHNFFNCEGSIAYMSVNQGLSQKVPVRIFEAWAYCPGGIVDHVWYWVERFMFGKKRLVGVSHVGKYRSWNKEKS